MKDKLNISRTYKKSDNLIILSTYNNIDWIESIFNNTTSKHLKKVIADERKYFFYSNGSSFNIVHFVKDESIDYIQNEKARQEGNTLIKLLGDFNITKFTILDNTSKSLVPFYVEGIILGHYKFTKYLTKDDSEPTPFDITIIGDDTIEQSIKNIKTVANATMIARDLVNEPVSYLTAPQLSKDIIKLGKKYGFDVSILDKAKITTLKMGGLLSVNRASKFEPRFNILEWKPKNAVNKYPVVLVGKGIVYDTGGLSLKPTGNSMDFMKSDMGGAATVIGAFVAASDANLPVHIIGLIPATDNWISEDSYAPGDVITMYDGSTVEVMNTDAEGRLVLADALHYAKKYKPELVIDFATLTGAAAFAVGKEAICCMGNLDSDTFNKFENSGFNTYERLIRFPLWNEYREYLKSNIADIRNLGGKSAGMITAGKFLEHFTDYNWMHFDIAGSAFLHSSSGYNGKEGTGVGVRLCFDFLNNYKA